MKVFICFCARFRLQDSPLTCATTMVSFSVNVKRYKYCSISALAKLAIL